MSSEWENGESLPGRFLQALRPARDLESNWAVDLAKNLDEYLLNICSGQISSQDKEFLTVNFAEAALLLQGSVQVYGRKVEYLYSLVLHVLDFISQKSREEQSTNATAQKNGASQSQTQNDSDSDLFFGFDDIAVDPKNLLDCTTSRDAALRYLVKAPADIAVLEGECVDIGADSEGLESYLLATSNLYRDFILLDPLDAVVIDNIHERKSGKGATSVSSSPMTFKGNKSFLSPCTQFGGTGVKLSVKKKQDGDGPQLHCTDFQTVSNDNDKGCSAADHYSHDNRNGDFENDDEYSEPDHLYNSYESDDPWKPLYPHEPGTLKVKPYKRVKAKGRRDRISRKHHSLISDFPLAKMHGPINSNFTEIWEARQAVSKGGRTSRSLSLYEKLRQSLVKGQPKIDDALDNSDDDMGDDDHNSGDPETESPDFRAQNDAYRSEYVPPPHDNNEDPEAQTNLEDLCRSHLDALLATLDENVMQSELSTRVSTWKQNIEQTLEEQDAHPPFDIHEYGERVLDKLSEEGESGSALSFGDVVKGQTKYDVARTFSAVLQLVNNGDVDFLRNSTCTSPSCHSNTNPFYVCLLGRNTQDKVKMKPKKRQKSPTLKIKIAREKKSSNGAKSTSPRIPSSSCSFSASVGKTGRAKCTPEGKKRRKSSTIAFLDLHSAG